jgi:mono/diheme cytochrome c family protein
MRTQVHGLLACLAAFLLALPLCGAEPDKTTLAARAQAILKTNCYRCHGDNGASEGGFNYVLERQRLVERKKVVAGDPGKSKLYQRVVSDNDPMPPADEKQRPSKEDRDLLRQWIEAGAPDFNPTIAKRAFLSPNDVLRAIHADLEKANERDRRFLRYFTLTHLSNAGFSDDELLSYRHGLSKLLNSLSWGRKVVAPRPIDATATVLCIDLRDYKWDEKTWDLIQAANPYNPSPDSAPGRNVLGDPYRGEFSLTGVFTSIKDSIKDSISFRSQFQHVRGDWFVFAASRPPLYHEVLQLPKTDRELEKRLELDVALDIEQERVARAGFNGSGVSRNNRLIERHESSYGAYWKSYDFSENADRKNLFEHPLGPGGDQGFTHDGGEIIFSLPNGLQGYLLVNAKGDRIDKGPTNIVTDKQAVKKGLEPDVVNGISCMSCHAKGMIAKTDQVREHVLKNRDAFGKGEADTILALYPAKDKFADLLQEDADRFRRAVNRTFGKTAAHLDDKLPETEPVVTLALLFEQELDLKLAAAEAGGTPDEFLRALEKAPKLARALGALKVEGGTVQRQAFVASFREMAAAVEELRSSEANRRKLVYRPFPGLGLLGLLPNQSVQEELKLTEEQKAKLKTALDRVRADREADLVELRKGPTWRVRSGISRRLNEATLKAIDGILPREQEARLKQIQFQQQGNRAYAEPEVQKALKLTDDQKARIKEILNGVTGTKATEATDKIDALLTDEQKQAFTALLGEKFAIKFESESGGK